MKQHRGNAEAFLRQESTKQTRCQTPLLRLAIDTLTLTSFILCLVTAPNAINNILLFVASVLFYATSSLTNRWPIGFPAIPFLGLQILRRFSLFSGPVLSPLLSTLSSVFLLTATLLSRLFPAFELPTPAGPYAIGTTNTFLPSKDGKTSIPVRLFYPTSTTPSRKTTPYLPPDLSKILCSEMMQIGGPHPVTKKMGWMLHTWRLARVGASPDVPVLSRDDGTLPLVVQSHGLFASASLYTYQAVSLASHGSVVCVLEHGDGSAPVVRREDGTFLYLDRSKSHLGKEGKWVEYVRYRRSKTNHRVNEMLSVLDALLHPTESTEPSTPRNDLLLSLSAKIDSKNVVLAGHSFGGATALSAAARRPDLVKGVVAHDPALDWMTDEGRRALFPVERMGDGDEYDGGTGGYETHDGREEKKSDGIDYKESRGEKVLHDMDLLVLFCEQWVETKWGRPDLFQSLHSRGCFGRKGGPSAVGTIDGALHQEFSDVCALTPLWLGRAIGMTSKKRHPMEILHETAERSALFVETVTGGTA